MGISSEKCLVGQFHHCVNITAYTYTDLDGTAHSAPRLYDLVLLLGYKPVQHCHCTKQHKIKSSTKENDATKGCNKLKMDAA